MTIGDISAVVGVVLFSLGILFGRWIARTARDEDRRSQDAMRDRIESEKR